MHLDCIALAGFRNLRDQTLELPREGVALIGRNGQGKTNFLEAVYYLETFRSFRGARDEQLVRFGSEHFRVMGSVDRSSPAGLPTFPGNSSPVRISAAYRGETREKRIAVDDLVVQRIGEAIGAIGAVLFTPEDVRMVSDGPAVRRRFLDVMLSLSDRNYLADLQRFRQVIAQRNAALRRGERGGVVEAWDAGLVEAGSRVTLARSSWIGGAASAFDAYCAEISGAGGGRVVYESSLPGVAMEAGEEELREIYRGELRRQRGTEGRMRTTLVGPHRDELRFYLSDPGGERDARDFGSGGQRRTVALALRLLEADTVRRLRGGEPLLLLDDVFAELDVDRSARLLRLLERTLQGQVILTAPKESDVRLRGGLLARWSVREGEVTGT